MSSPAAEVRLSRSVATRLFGGGSFQWLLTVVLVLEVALIGVVASFVGAGALLAALPALIVVVPWVLGVTAWARADADGVHWRYYRSRSCPWPELERIEFGAVTRAGANVPVRIPALRVVTAGHSHPIGPTAGVDAHRLTAFARGLADLARAHGIPAGPTVADSWWAEQGLG